MSKCGKNKKVEYEAIAECVTNVLTTFWRLLWSITKQTPATWNLLFYMITKQTTRDKAFFIFKIFQHNAKAGLCSAFPDFGKHEKGLWRNLLSIQNKVISLVAMRSKELWCVQENLITVKPGSIRPSFTPRSMNEWTYSESRFELRNLQILRKMF